MVADSQQEIVDNEVADESDSESGVSSRSDSDDVDTPSDSESSELDAEDGVHNKSGPGTNGESFEWP